ncbi:hypothetical protein ANN_16579 [Periplaneta americana]|uniref:C2H2-type domain-containing protein n=1 Tax=Periplaneta americana TaxID=6978 RepID=A0ABQ8SRK4_PERAM|nr:hypothetical protein ANN_16579 [Periplaneta americana]
MPERSSGSIGKLQLEPLTSTNNIDQGILSCYTGDLSFKDKVVLADNKIEDVLGKFMILLSGIVNRKDRLLPLPRLEFDDTGVRYKQIKLLDVQFLREINVFRKEVSFADTSLVPFPFLKPNCSSSNCSSILEYKRRFVRISMEFITHIDGIEESAVELLATDTTHDSDNNMMSICEEGIVLTFQVSEIKIKHSDSNHDLISKVKDEGGEVKSKETPASVLFPIIKHEIEEEEYNVSPIEGEQRLGLIVNGYKGSTDSTAEPELWSGTKRQIFDSCEESAGDYLANADRTPTTDFSLDCDAYVQTEDKSKPLISDQNVMKHSRKRNRDSIHKCNFCGKTFQRNCDLKRHIFLHTEPKLYKCGVCGKCFTQFSTCQNHLATHSLEKSYVCDNCGRIFRNYMAYVAHERIQKCFRSFICEICGKLVSGTSYFELHMLDHTGEKPFKCASCEKEFASDVQLEQHSLLHINDRSFECGICGIRFTFHGVWESHMRLHMLVKSCTCDICGKYFYNKTDLEVHLRKHTVEKPFKCDFCGEKFVRESLLIIHSRKHTGWKPYLCHICGQSFTINRHLQMHVDTH